MAQTHSIPVGAKVKVRFQSGWIGGRFYRTGWRVGTVAAHSTIGEARIPGGFPTYDVIMIDGARIDYCAAACVRAR